MPRILSMLLVAGMTCCAFVAKADEFIADRKTGCRIFNPAPVPDESAQWSGACKGGKADGSGVLRWFVRNEPADRFEGRMREGRPVGKGIYRYSDGGQYEGDWVDGVRAGRGELRYGDGGRYVGDWAGDARAGRGVLELPNGGRYDGEWRADRMHGTGTMSFPDGIRYTGPWVEDHMHGRGVMTWPSGDRYEGDFRADERTGTGRYQWADGTRYDGDFVKGRCTGHGEQTWRDGRRYIGEYVDGLFHGEGHLREADGRILVGRFVRGAYAGNEAAEQAARERAERDARRAEAEARAREAQARELAAREEAERKSEEAERQREELESLRANLQAAQQMFADVDRRRAATRDLQRRTEALKTQRNAPVPVTPVMPEIPRARAVAPPVADAPVARDTASQMQSGSARDIRSSKQAIEAGTGNRSGTVPTQSRFTSEPVNHCVELIPKGFKCCDVWHRCLTNICAQRISVKWRVGNGSWGLDHFNPGQCRPADGLTTRSDERVQWQACSWDPRAGPGNGPLMTPDCRY